VNSPEDETAVPPNCAFPLDFPRSFFFDKLFIEQGECRMKTWMLAGAVVLVLAACASTQVDADEQVDLTDGEMRIIRRGCF
jgi:hypothetical protein